MECDCDWNLFVCDAESKCSSVPCECDVDCDYAQPCTMDGVCDSYCPKGADPDCTGDPKEGKWCSN